MTKPAATTEAYPTYLPPLPGWVTQNHGNTLELETFLSGASLAMLHMLLADPGGVLPAELLRNRLALRAAETCLKLEGRRDSEAEIRDAYYLARAGDASGAASAMGPAGEMYVRWRKASAIGLTHKDWLPRLKACVPEQIAQELPEWIDAVGQGGPAAIGSPIANRRPVANGSPMDQAAKMVGLVIAAFPREEASALICGDMVLARALGWSHPLPLLGVHLKRRDLQATEDDLLIACCRAVAKGAQDAVRLSHDLTRRALRLREVAPKLRAKGSAEAVALFLREDAVMPSTMLTRVTLPSPKIKGTKIAMTDRAARRFCDRLVELGVVRELTGRPTFRLYGLA